MARYSPEHKARSRAALKTAAAALFRNRGFTETSIDDLCAEAGLTRGTFYAHFASKEQLFNEIMEGPHDLIERLRAQDKHESENGAIQVLQDYLTPNNRSAVLGGCSLASLAAETMRTVPAARAAYASAVESLIEELRRVQPKLSRESALAAAATAVGGLLMSGACGDAAVADELETAARRAVTDLLDTWTR